ncbi:MAG: RNA polymerase sigma factor [Bacteroidetes bacterium]|jgi:RNA polymerase sigma factor (sigma-70 family)|nr:RNA polymerase sigma factor [Bacteroidota bacterium]MBT6686813.1 RNA polymerase sigma factor [Bacteroidota bacterium]MBT7144143.1 RNA polymerase sigma factor [Bacteroidota bacterium]MBT7490079.1 RNA polymerase sigma factor [Bacteroidota bacterium]
MQSEKNIIEGCIRNSRKYQKILYERYSQVLLGICYRYARDKSEAEDILQEGFIKIFYNIKQYSGAGSFEGWMKRIIVNTSITHYHKNLKHNYNDDINEIRETKIEENTFEDADFTREELFSVINELPHGYKTIFNLYAIEGYKHKEIAEKLEIDINTSKSQFSRARKQIQKKLIELSRIKEH